MESRDLSQIAKDFLDLKKQWNDETARNIVWQMHVIERSANIKDFALRTTYNQIGSKGAIYLFNDDKWQKIIKCGKGLLSVNLLFFDVATLQPMSCVIMSIRLLKIKPVKKFKIEYSDVMYPLEKRELYSRAMLLSHSVALLVLVASVFIGFVIFNIFPILFFLGSITIFILCRLLSKRISVIERKINYDMDALTLG